MLRLGFILTTFCLSMNIGSTISIHNNQLVSDSLLTKENKSLLNKYKLSEDITCSKKPYLVNTILSLGKSMGVRVIYGKPKLENKDATYEAFPGKLGIITIKNRPMSQIVYCQLVTHEFIHVLQHIHGDLNSVKPLGLELKYIDIYRNSSLQEAEAYAYQDYIGYIIDLLNFYSNQLNHSELGLQINFIFA